MNVLITALLVLVVAAPAVAADGSEEDKQALNVAEATTGVVSLTSIRAAPSL